MTVSDITPPSPRGAAIIYEWQNSMDEVGCAKTAIIAIRLNGRRYFSSSWSA